MSPELCEAKEKERVMSSALEYMQTAFNHDLSMSRSFIVNNIGMLNFWRDQMVDRKKAERKVIEGIERFVLGAFDFSTIANQTMTQKIYDFERHEAVKLMLTSVHFTTNAACDEIAKYLQGREFSRELNNDIFSLPLLNLAELLIQTNDWRLKDYGLRLVNISHSAIKQAETPSTSLARVYNLYAAYFFDKKDPKSAHKLLDSVINMRVNPVKHSETRK